MQELFNLGEENWELGLESDNIKIYRKLKSEDSVFMVKC